MRSLPRPFPLPGAQPHLLVSVRDAAEAALAAIHGADLIDAKDPERGALGALPPETVRAIVAAVGSRAITSAVAGEVGADLPPTLLPDAVARIAATGPRYVKVAPGVGADRAALARAALSAPGGLIAVLFAEDGIDPDAAKALAACGLAGAMVDTRTKDGRRLPDLVGRETLAAFVAACREAGLVSGLAGSLSLADIPGLAALAPDYLGFRGGLCRAGARRGALDPERVAEAVRRLRAVPRRDAA